MANIAQARMQLWSRAVMLLRVLLTGIESLAAS